MRLATQQPAPAHVPAVETDEHGREVHDVAHRGAGTINRVPPSAAMTELWAAGDKIDQPVWLQIYNTVILASLQGPDATDLAECASVADRAYYEYHLKRNPRARVR